MWPGDGGLGLRFPLTSGMELRCPLAPIRLHVPHKTALQRRVAVALASAFAAAGAVRRLVLRDLRSPPSRLFEYGAAEAATSR